MDLKELIKNKKAVNLIAVALIAAVVLIIYSPTEKEEPKISAENPETMLESRLEEILRQVKGAGRVSVFVVLEDYGISDYVTDTRSGQRETEEKTVIAGSQPIISRTQTPQIKGVIVAAQGAGKKEVSENLKAAVETALGVMPHRVKILERK